MPPSRGSKILNLVKEVKKLRCGDLSWRVKIVEQSGTPLILNFGNTFPMEKGCTRGDDCVLCKNNCIGCTTRGVVYNETCTDCGEDVLERGSMWARRVAQCVKEYMNICLL